MTVKDLIERLRKLDPKLPVYKGYFDAGGEGGSGFDLQKELFSVEHRPAEELYPDGLLPERVLVE